jgi:hypothetical protein
MEVVHVTWGVAPGFYVCPFQGLHAKLSGTLAVIQLQKKNTLTHFFWKLFFKAAERKGEHDRRARNGYQ